MPAPPDTTGTDIGMAAPEGTGEPTVRPGGGARVGGDARRTSDAPDGAATGGNGPETVSTAPAAAGDGTASESAHPCASDPRAQDGDAVGAEPRAGAPPPAVAGLEQAGEPAPDPGGGQAAVAAPTDPAVFAQALRVAEALVFASDRPVAPARLQGALPPGCDARAVLAALAEACAGRPVQLVEVAGGFAFRTAPELAPAITRVVEVPRRLPRAAMETLAIVAYHQPVTRAEIEEIRGASLSQSTLEILLDASLIAPRGRKEVPGRPSLWGTTPRFLEQFGLKALSDLPRREELVNEPTLPLGAPQPPAA